MKAFTTCAAVLLACQQVSALSCNYEGTLYKICKYANAWSHEDGAVCVGITRCVSQSPPYGVTTANVTPKPTTPLPTTTKTPTVTPPTTPPVTTTTTPPPVSGNVIWSLDFENETTGSQPSGWSNFIGWVPNNSNSKSGGDYAVVDTGRAKSGSKALHVKTSQTGPAQIVKKLPANSSKIYTRMWMYTSHKMGGVPSDNHEHFTGLKADENGSFSGNNEIRVGSGKGTIGFNHVPSDAICPPYGQWGQGPSIPTNTWTCVEVGYEVGGSYDSIYMWVDGTLVQSVTKAADWHSSVANGWLSKQMGYLMLGWHSFSGNAAEIWFDDVVVATGRVGC